MEYDTPHGFVSRQTGHTGHTLATRLSPSPPLRFSRPTSPKNMIVYKDLISGDEMMTDAFPQNPVVCDGETIEGMFEVRGGWWVCVSTIL